MMRFKGEEGQPRSSRHWLVSLLLLTGCVLAARAVGQQPCAVTNDAPFIVTLAAVDPDGVTLTWPGCSDRVYVVFAAASLETNTAWTPFAWRRGEDGPTSWTDTDTAGIIERFYEVERLPQDGDEDGDGMPNGFEVNNGLNLLVPTDATLDPDDDGVDNRTEYLQGRDPRKGAVADSAGLLNLNVFTPLE